MNTCFEMSIPKHREYFPTSAHQTSRGSGSFSAARTLLGRVLSSVLSCGRPHRPGASAPAERAGTRALRPAPEARPAAGPAPPSFPRRRRFFPRGDGYRYEPAPASPPPATRRRGAAAPGPRSTGREKSPEAAAAAVLPHPRTGRAGERSRGRLYPPPAAPHPRPAPQVCAPRRASPRLPAPPGDGPRHRRRHSPPGPARLGSAVPARSCPTPLPAQMPRRQLSGRSASARPAARLGPPRATASAAGSGSTWPGRLPRPRREGRRRRCTCEGEG